MTDTSYRSDRILLDAIQEFVATHPDPELFRFRDTIANWGEEWIDVAPHHLPAADRLPDMLDLTVPATHDLVAKFEAGRASRKWEQSYKKTDGVVGDDMLSDYGFAEVVGKWGPFVSDRARSGIGVWGSNIEYPPHRHKPEEIYVVVAGSAEFLLGEPDAPSYLERSAGQSVYVPSLTRHGFRTNSQPLVVFYIWQADSDLREISTFG